jgi:hypothetical protein
LACSHAWFLSAVLHEWTLSSLYGLNRANAFTNAEIVFVEGDIQYGVPGEILIFVTTVGK